jgi:signal transduction histidine kinase
MDTGFFHTLRKRLDCFKRKMHIPDISLRLLTTLLCLLAFARLVENNTLFPKFDQRHAQKVQKIFTGKERALLKHMDELARCIDTATGTDSCFVDFQKRYEKILEKHGLYIFAYSPNDSLAYWSTKDVPAAATYSQSGFGKAYINLKNGRYASFVRQCNNYTVAGLILIKNIYTYENKYLKTAFQKDFKLPASVKIFPEYIPDYHPITDSQGKFMWSLIFDGTCYYPYQIYLPAAAYLLAILIFFTLMDSLFQRLRQASSRNAYLPFLALALVSIRCVMQYRKYPQVFYDLELFNPVYFASKWFPSLGELGLWCLFTCFFIYELYRYLRFPLFYEHRWKYFLYTGISLFVTVIGFLSISLLVRALVIDSSNIFEGPNRIILLNGFSILGYFMLMFFLAAFCLLLDKALCLCRQEMTFRQFLISFSIVLPVTVIGWALVGLPIEPLPVIVLALMAYMMGLVRLKKNIKFKYPHYILIVFVLAVYTTVQINQFSIIKYADQKKVIVTNLASQHDLTAEFLLEDINKRIIADTAALADVAYDAFYGTGSQDIYDYMKRNFFYGSFWNRYRLQCVLCNDTSKLVLIGQRQVPDCVGYFNDMIDRNGNQLPRSEFYYINQQSNYLTASTYIGWFRKEKEGNPPLYLFIDLSILHESNEVGYPELLLDSRTGQDNNLNNYSYAKYYDNRRITQYGSYKYNLSGDIFQAGQGDFYAVHADGMEHLVYRPDRDSMIVLSSHSPKPVDLLINFSYIFIFSYVIVSLFLFLFYLPMVKRIFQWNFRSRIQYTMIAILLISFAIVGVGTVFYINRQYTDKNNDIINEKMQAVHSELLDAIVQLKNTDPEWDDSKDILTEGLMYFKEVFFTDFNLYDVNGQLIATSLPDIFDRGLLGRQMNPDAYIKLTFGQRASIMEHENIGGLHYLSAYEPFVDNNSKVMAFLNLPYFTQQDALTEEISNVIMTFTNFYMVIILLTVIVSIIMSNQITQPLIMLQEKFRNIKLGAKNEPVIYNSQDEIGGLVKEYNRAIDELALSANRLARSERESAWREMAKQIAHEINNPLTPMKLSIQHLKRAWDNQSERFDEYMEKISQSLVEQIDALSSIATEFSSFAKMPAAQNQQVDLIAKIKNTIPLFATGENKRAFHADFHGLEQAMVCADKEQMSRVFINLFKNALQSIPKDRQTKIDVDVLRINHILWIRIKDNGNGIPAEIQEKIFRPNFTTKSSGMGMGLAIVHNIIESAGGTINFKTQQGEGTAFIISLPVSD